MRLLLILALALPLAAQDYTGTVPPGRLTLGTAQDEIVIGGQRLKASDWTIVYAGIAAHAIGSALDGASSWGQYEQNSILRGSDGRFGGKAVGLKAGEFGVSTAVTYLIARKWPKMRKALGIVNFGMGVTNGVVAIKNLEAR